MINNNRNGFSLIELMIVIVIISILTGFAALEVRREIKHAQEETLKNNLKVLRQQIDNFYADRGYYPTNLDDLTKGKYPYFASLPEDTTTKLVDWQVRPPKINSALNSEDRFIQQPSPADYPHVTASSTHVTDDDALEVKFKNKISGSGDVWESDFNSQVKSVTNYNEIYGKELDEEVFSDGTFNNFITSLQGKTNFFDKDTDDTNALSEEAYAIVYDDAANQLRGSPAQAIDGDLKTYWITATGVRDAWIKIELPEDPILSDYIKVESIVVNFNPPYETDVEYKLYEVRANIGGSDTYILNEDPDTGNPLTATRNNNYMLTITNPFKEDADRISHIQLGVKAYGGADPRPAIAEIMVFRAPYDKPLPGDTSISSYRWDVWRNYNPPGGVSDVKSNNASFYDW